MISHTQFEIAAVTGVALWSYSYGRLRGLRAGATRMMRVLSHAATASGLLSEFDSLLRAVYDLHTQPKKGQG